MGAYNSAPLPTKVFITSGSGYVGKAALQAFAEDYSVDVTVSTRDVSKSADKITDALPRANVVQVDDRVPASIDAAIAGAQVLVIIPPGAEDRGDIAERFAAAAARSSACKHVILISVPNALEDGSILFQRQFAKAENAVKAAHVPYSIFRLDFFLENFYGMAESIKATKKLYLFLGQGTITGTSLEDVGACIWKVATSADRSKYANKTYTLTASDALTGAEIATTLSELADSQITYESVEDPNAVVDSFKGMGLPDWQARGMVELLDMFKNNKGPRPNNDVQTILGRPPKSLRDVYAASAPYVFAAPSSE